MKWIMYYRLEYPEKPGCGKQNTYAGTASDLNPKQQKRRSKSPPSSLTGSNEVDHVLPAGIPGKTRLRKAKHLRWDGFRSKPQATKATFKITAEQPDWVE